jgi:hypothetical protein
MAERDDLERFLAEEILAYRTASRSLNDPPQATKALAHVLKWAYSLHEWLKKNHAAYTAWHASDSAYEHLHGALYVRDIDTHDFSTVVEVSPAMFPLELPQPFFDLVWKPLSALPAPDASIANRKSTKEKQAAYVKYLQGVPARMTLLWLEDLFKRAPR